MFQFQCVSNRFFQLAFTGIAVSRQNLFGLPYRNLLDGHVDVASRQEDNTGNLAEQNTGFGILLERENIFDHHQVRHFLPQHPEDFGINDLKAFGLFLFLGCGDTAEGKPVDAQPVPVDHPDPCVGKAGIDAEDFH